MVAEKNAANQVASVGGKDAPEIEAAQSAAIASRGIRTADDAANFLSALIGDVMTGDVREKTANSACNAMGKLLKVVDMKHRFAGEPNADGGPKPLKLADPTDSRRSLEMTRRQQLQRELAELDARERVAG